MIRDYYSSLHFRLLLIVFLTVLPAAGLVLRATSNWRRHDAAEVQADTLRLARLASADQERLIEGGHQLLAALARLPEVRSGDAAACNTLFADLLKLYPFYADFVATAPDGDVFCSAVPLTQSVNAADRAWFQRTVQARDFAAGDYQIGRITGKAILVLGYPVLDAAGNVQAVVSAGLDLTWLSQLVDEAQLPEGSTVAVVDRNGTILVRYPDPEQWVGQSMPAALVDDTILTQQDEGTAEGPGLDGVPRLFAFTRLREVAESGSIYVSVGIPTAIAFAEANRSLVRNLLGLGVIVVLSLAVIWLGSELFVVRPINALLRTAERLAAGDLSARIGPASYGQGELGRLARTFDHMAASLEQQTAQLREAEARYRDLFDNVTKTNELLEKVFSDIHVMIAYLDADFNFIRVNRAYAEADERPPEFFVGKNHFDLYPHAENEAIFRKVVETGTPYTAYAKPFEFPGHPEWGVTYWDWTLQPIKDADGAVTELLLSIINVTERKRAEEELLRLNRALRVLSDCNQTVVRATEESDLLQAICRIIVEEGGYRLAWIGFAGQDEDKTVHPVAQAGYEEGYLETLNITWADTERGRGPTGTAIRTGEPVIARDISTDPHFAPWREEAHRRSYASSIALPLISEGQSIGALNIYAAEPDAFDTQEVELLEELASDLAFGITTLRMRAERQQAEAERARLFSEVQRQAEELGALAEVSAAMRQARSRQAMAPLLLEKTAEVLGADGGALLLLEEDTLVLTASHSFIQEPAELHVPPDDSFLWQAIRTGEPLIVSNAVKQCASRRCQVCFMLATEPRTCVVVPLKSAETTVGLLNLVYQSHHEFSEVERRILTAIADMAGNALHRMSIMETLEQRVAQRTRELKALYEVVTVASAPLDPPNTLKRVLKEVLHAMQSDVGVVHLLDETGDALHLAGHQGVSPDAQAWLDLMLLNSGLVSRVLERGGPLVIADITDYPRVPPLPDTNELQAYAGAPIQAGGDRLGVLSVARTSRQQFNVEEVALLASIADQVGVIMENIRLYAQAQQAAVLEERHRLARELHDAVTQSLYSLTLFTEVGRELVERRDWERLATCLSEIDESAGQALKNMRLLVHELRPAILETEGLAGALQQRLDAVEERANVTARLFVEGALQETGAAVELPASVEEALYRIAQEALNNTLKHAEASSVAVYIRADNATVELEIVDDGCGFDPQTAMSSRSGGLGLISMHERAGKLGGTLTITSTPGQGTRVIVNCEL